jgi:hypothetical protein
MILKKELSAIGIALSVLFLASTITNNVTVQNMSTNVSNAAGNMSASRVRKWYKICLVQWVMQPNQLIKPGGTG